MPPIAHPPELPAPGTRVSLRYRRPHGSVPPLSDVIGVLTQLVPAIEVRTKTGAVVTVTPDDVVAVRVLTDVPVRTSDIRAVEYAAALAWPGTEQQWLDGWLLRFGDGHTHRANSAVPVDISARLTSVPEIIAWYADRGVTPWLSVPDRVLQIPTGIASGVENLVMVRDLGPGPPSGAVTVAPAPGAGWRDLYQRPVPVPILTAVLDGTLGFGDIAGVAVGRVALTPAPDGTRWAGLSAVRVDPAQRRRGHARVLCDGLLAWAGERGATRAYLQVLADNHGAIALYDSMGFHTQHRVRYVDAREIAQASL